MDSMEETRDWLRGKTIKDADITGDHVRLDFNDGTNLYYSAADGGHSNLVCTIHRLKKEAAMDDTSDKLTKLEQEVAVLRTTLQDLSRQMKDMAAAMTQQNRKLQDRIFATEISAAYAHASR